MAVFSLLNLPLPHRENKCMAAILFVKRVFSYSKLLAWKNWGGVSTSGSRERGPRPLGVLCWCVSLHRLPLTTFSLSREWSVPTTWKPAVREVQAGAAVPTSVRRQNFPVFPAETPSCSLACSCLLPRQLLPRAPIRDSDLWGPPRSCLLCLGRVVVVCFE